MPGNYRWDVYVNQSWLGRQTVRVRETTSETQEAYCFTPAQLSAWGLDIDKLPSPESARQMLDNDPCVSLRLIVPEAILNVDPAELRIDISLPQAYLGRNARGYVDPKYWDKGITAGFLGYNLSAFYNDSQAIGDTTQYFGSLNAGLNLGDWRLRYNASYNRSEVARGESNSHYQSISTYAQRDITALKSQWTLGEYFTPSELFDSVPFFGMQLHSDDRMLPDSMRGFAPVIRGMAETNAKVTITQNEGNVLHEIAVPPGPFIIDDLYNTGYAGDLTVTVTEADGRRKSFIVPYSSVAQMLRPGISRYSVTAGEYRDDSLDHHPKFLQATYQRGISNRWSLYGGAILSEDYSALQSGIALSTSLGALALDVTQSRAENLPAQLTEKEKMSGQSYRLTYSHLVATTQTHFTLAAYRFSSENYLNFADFARYSAYNDDYLYEPYQQRNRFQLTLSQPLGKTGGQLYASGSAQNYWNESLRSDVTYQLGYSKGFSWGSFNLGVSRTRDTDGGFDTQYLLTLSVPLGYDKYLSTWTSSLTYTDHRNSGLQSTLSGVTGENNQTSYSVFGSHQRFHGDTSDIFGVNGQYRAPFAVFNAGASSGNDYDQASLGLSGNVVAHSQGVNFTQNQGETMAIIQAKGAAGASVSNNVGAKVGSNGFAVVSGLMPYRINEIAIDPKGISKQVELQTTSQTVAPRFGSIVKLEYETQIGRPFLLTVRDGQGQPLPMGADVRDLNGNSLSMVSQGGRIFLRGLPDEGQLIVIWGKEDTMSCRVNYRLPAPLTDDEGFYEQTNAMCSTGRESSMPAAPAKPLPIEAPLPPNDNGAPMLQPIQPRP